jgi:hypothetical protein
VTAEAALENPNPDPALEELDRRVSAIEERLKRLESAVPRVVRAAQRLVQAHAELSALLERSPPR